MISILKLGRRLKELFTVHVPDSKLIDYSYDDVQGQQNLDICERITNKGD
jgi:hypothetical protein